MPNGLFLDLKKVMVSLREVMQGIKMQLLRQCLFVRLQQSVRRR